MHGSLHLNYYWHNWIITTNPNWKYITRKIRENAFSLGEIEFQRQNWMIMQNQSITKNTNRILIDGSVDSWNRIIGNVQAYSDFYICRVKTFCIIIDIQIFIAGQADKNNLFRASWFQRALSVLFLFRCEFLIRIQLLLDA